MKVFIKQTFSSFKIYFDEVLHLVLTKDELIGIQSWINRDSNFNIEYTFKDGATIKTEYIDKKIFKEILIQLDNLIW